ncbi:MAG: rhomboid family intramembrane serine protease [Candidatus Lokiarchaeota archaeon]|nr:rhomboid family intramembrane serine protease [Candidatus Lokiarchaeota archaeon]
MGIEPPSPYKGFPYVTVGLIVLNVLIFLITTLIFSSIPFVLEENSITQELIFYPSDFFAGKNWYSLFTSQFLHGGVLHIISNMYFLLIFGDDMEFCFGRPGFIIFYLFSGVIAGMFFAVMELLYAVLVFPTNIDAILNIGAVGASGALFGVMAGYGFSFPNRRLKLVPGSSKTIKAKNFVLFYVALEIIYTVAGLLGLIEGDTTAHAAHIGGFLGGLAFTYLFKFLNNKRYTQIKNLEI